MNFRMDFQDFDLWVVSMGQSPKESINCFNKIEAVYGHIVSHYNKDKCAYLLKEFTYTKSDLEEEKPRHKMKFKSKFGQLTDKSFIEQTSQFRSHIRRYCRFRESFDKK